VVLIPQKLYAIKLIAEHDGRFLSSLLLLSSIASRSIIVGNQDESFGKSRMRFRIGAGQSIDRVLRVGNQSRCGRCVSHRALELGPPVVCWWRAGVRGIG
jgi:hypothetical protein